MEPRTHSILYFLGRPISPLYALAMKLRVFLYKKQFFKQHRVDVPVISIGNLTMGGTGKTPLVINIAELLVNQGFNPAVISRGYHGRSKLPANIISDGTSLLMQVDMAGDEPVLMAERLVGVVVATGKKRVLPCLEVIKKYGCDVIVLDDGFQHLSLARTLDLVLFDVNHFAGNSRVFPGGELREPVTALSRCDAFVLTGVIDGNRERAEKCRALLRKRFPDKAVFLSSNTYSRVVKQQIAASGISRESIELSELPENLFCFCGIGHPERFFQMIDQYAIVISGRKSFPDHHNYTPADISQLCTEAKQAGAAGFLTTQKDLVKLSQAHQCPLPFFAPMLTLSSAPELADLVLEKIKKAK